MNTSRLPGITGRLGHLSDGRPDNKLSTMFRTAALTGIALSLALSGIAPSLPASAQKGAHGASTVPFKLVRPTEKAEVAPEVSWLPAGKPKVVMLCIHGLGLHKGNYEGFGKEMSKNGIAVYAIDMRGFGAWLDNGKHKRIDFDGSLADVEAELKKIHGLYPDVPVVIAGESMGGAIALRTAALYPNLVAGLVSSVPSGDRFGEMNQDLKVGMHVLFGGFNKPMNIGNSIVSHATKKEDLRKNWEHDPEGKMKLTPSELMAFQKFMKENFEAAKTISSVPVLFIQGATDKLVRPAGTWQLYDNLATPNRQLVLSKSGEHLIFEEDQFSKDDLVYVRTWINRNVTPLDTSAIASAKTESTNSTDSTSSSLAKNDGAPVAALSGPGTDSGASAAVSSTGASSTAVSNTATTAVAPVKPVDAKPSSAKPTDNKLAVKPADAKQPAGKSGEQKPVTVSVATVHAGAPVSTSKPSPTFTTMKIAGLNYWIELYRGGKSYRCNNKTQFKSGDSIRFHVVPETDGYAYVVMKEGSTGKSAILFPSKETGLNNHLIKGHDYPMPSKIWFTFDNHPGVERITLVYSKAKTTIDPNSQQLLTAYVSPNREGSKDLVPTRMQLSWEDPTPVIIPDDYIASSEVTGNSMVRLHSNQPSNVLSVDVALEHR